MAQVTSAPIRVLAAALGAFGAAPALAQNVAVIYGTNWVALAEHGGSCQAVADGTDAACGLDVTIVPGGPSVNNQALLLAGKLDFDMGGVLDAFYGVGEGDLIALPGQSGCGKSTALRLIAGLMRPTAGRIIREGGQGGDDLGVVFQEPTLMPWATVVQNVWLPFRLRGKSLASVRPRIEEVLRLVGLEAFANNYRRELSGGMKMRVSIARALVTSPRLILMDEPFAALDEITRQKLNNDLPALKAATGCTIIFVTHSVFESVFLSDRILVMAPRPGRVVRELTIDEPYPRGLAFRISAKYGDFARETSEAPMAGMGEGVEAPA